MKIGDLLLNFVITDIHGKSWDSSTVSGKILILNFWSAECPWCNKVDEPLARLVQQWGNRVDYICVAPNTNETIENLRKTADERHISTVLLDKEQSLANQLDALTTPHFYVFDVEGKLRYQGGFDDTSFRQRVPTRQLLEDAINALLTGKAPKIAESPPFGCTIVRFGK